MARFDTVIKGGTIFDGMRTPRYVGDIGICDGVIEAVGGIDAADADQVIDAEGLHVAPGFVDLHTHYDSQVYWDPWCTISGYHGVTSVAIGNCGFGFAPVKPEDRERSMQTMTRNEAVPLESMQAGMPWDWETFPEFLDSIERTPKGVNIISYVPLNPLMAYVMGVEAAKGRPANDEERAELHRLMREALDAGACGWSGQLTDAEMEVQRDFDGSPMITNLMTEDDLIAFAEVLRDAGRGLIQCIGASQELTEKLAEASGRPILWNVLALFADQHGNPQVPYEDTIAWLHDANARGLRLYAQALTVENDFQFTLEDWNLFDTVEVWREVLMGDVEQRRANLLNEDNRRRIRDAFDAGAPMLALTDDLLVGIVHEPGLKEIEGYTVGEIAQIRDCHVVDAFIDVALEDNMRALFITPPRPADNEAMSQVIHCDVSLPGVSDGGAHTKFLTHGRYPTEFLALLCRDNELMDLEQAHWRLSAYPAQAAGITDRGWIREGAPADIIVYDLDELHVGEPERAWDFPAGAWRLVQKPRGYRYIMVNGEVTFRDGECTGATPGSLLRHGSA